MDTPPTQLVEGTDATSPHLQFLTIEIAFKYSNSKRTITRPANQNFAEQREN